MKMKFKCAICDNEINYHTAVVTSHLRKHVREGVLKEKKNSEGKLEFHTKDGTIITPSKPKKNANPNYVGSSSFRTRKSVPPSRIPTVAKLKKNKIILQCNTCKKWNAAVNFLADERFVASHCCDKVSLLSKRLIEAVKETPASF